MIEKTIFIVKPIYVPVKSTDKYTPLAKTQEDIYSQKITGPKYQSNYQPPNNGIRIKSRKKPHRPGQSLMTRSNSKLEEGPKAVRKQDKADPNNGVKSARERSEPK